MSIYTPNNKTPFLFALALLLFLVLLLVPMRPSHWNQEEEVSTIDTLTQITSPKDSVVVTIVMVPDTQLVVHYDPYTNTTDTNTVVVPTETYDTTVISVVNAIVPIKTAEDSPEKAGGESSFFLIYLLSFLFTLGVFAMFLIRFLTARMEQNYWVEYSSGAALLDPKKIASSSTMDFVVTTKEPVLTIEKEPIVEQVILEPVEEPIPEKVVEIVQQEAPKKETKKELQEKINAQIKEKLQKKHQQKVEGIPLAATLKEYLTRPILIVVALVKGLTSIFNYFGTIKTDTAPVARQAVDFKWQDFVSILVSIFSVITIRTFYPITPTTVANHLIIYALLWLMPNFLRQDWKRGVFGVFIFLSELIALLIYWVLEMSKGEATSDVNIGPYLVSVVALLVGLFWAKLFASRIKFPTLNKGILVSISVVTVVAFVLFKDYFGGTIFEAYASNNGWFGLVGRGAILFLIYLTTRFIILAFEPKEKLVVEATDNSDNEEANTATKRGARGRKKNKNNLTAEELKLLMQQKEWWKKAPLDRLEEISMPNYNLDETSDFVQLYLPDCINVRRLYLSNNLFNQIPFEVTDLKQLQLLNLSHNNIHKITPGIQYLEQLDTLYLSHNKLKDIPEEIGKLTNLKFLDLTGNALPLNVIDKLKKLLPNTLINYDSTVKEEPLEEDENLVAKVERLLTKELGKAEGVYYISALMEQDLSDLPLSVLQKFTNVKSILLHNNKFTQIPEALYHLPSLTTISLPYNQLTTIPDRIEDLTNLEELDITNNPIVSFSPKITTLKKLKNLRLSYLGLKEIPAFVFQIKALNTLDLSSNHLLRLPEEIASLTKLKSLDLSFTGLSVIPPSVLGLADLEYLNWAGNQLAELPVEHQFRKLHTLSLSYNEGVIVPQKSFAQLPNLRTIHLAGLKMDEHSNLIPYSWLQNVESLWLNNNRYSTIPNAIFELEKLKSLSLSGNALAKISGDITQLKNLSYLYLANNKLMHLPKNLDQLKKLTTLHLQNNNFGEEEKLRIQEMLPKVTVLF